MRESKNRRGGALATPPPLVHGIFLSLIWTPQPRIVSSRLNHNGHLTNSTNTSARPEVRGTADVGWRSLFPLSINPPRTHTHDYIITHVNDRRAVIDGHEWLKDADAAYCAPFSFPFVARGVVYVRRGPHATTSFGPQHELPPARLALQRQPSAQNSVRRRGMVQTRSGILAFLCTRHH